MNKKIVYNIDSITRAYIGDQECYKSSIDQDSWNWVGTALEVAPPATQENEIAVANEELSNWVIQPFFVGVKYWLPDGSAHVIAEIGEIPPSDALYEAPVIPPSDEEIIKVFASTIQTHLDEFAQTRNYDNCLSCCSYVNSTFEKFAIEAQYMIERRDACWAAGYQIIADVKAGKRDIPTKEQLLIEIGTLEWIN